MSNFFKSQAAKAGVSAEDITFALAQKGTRITSQAVRMWLRGDAIPSLEFAEPLAAILKTTKAKVLDGMHELAVDRAADIAAK